MTFVNEKIPEGEKLRVILLSYFPVDAFSLREFTASFRRVSIRSLKFDSDVADEVRCYIKYKPILGALEKALGFELQPINEPYQHNTYDIIYIIFLKKTLRGKYIEELEPDDLVIYRSIVLKGAWF